MKYEAWLEEWLTLYVKPSVKMRTYEKYAQFVRLHIRPELGELELSNLSAMRLQKFISGLSETGNHRTGKGLSGNTLNGIITVLERSINQASESRIIPTDYVVKLRRPQTEEKEIECFSVEEQKKIEGFAKECNTPKFNGILLCLYTGLRIGELLALEWTDIDFARGLLTIRKSCHDGKGGRVTEPPKTTTSKRVIPLPKQLLSLLKDWRKQAKTQYVVEDKERGVGVRSYQKTFELLQKRLRIPHRGFHALRHTFATRAIECGMDVKTLSEILGHKNPTVTLKRYTHSLTEHKKEMMNRIGRLL